jgi:hypothetical protein
MDKHGRPLLALLSLLLCLALLRASSAASVTAGTPDGTERWGFVEVRPSNVSPSRLHFPYLDPIFLLLGRHFRARILKLCFASQRLTCSGGTTRAPRGFPRRPSHGRPSSGFREARYGSSLWALSVSDGLVRVLHVLSFVVSGSVWCGSWQLHGGRAAGREPEAPQLDMAEEGRPHLRGIFPTANPTCSHVSFILSIAFRCFAVYTNRVVLVRTHVLR